MGKSPAYTGEGKTGLFSNWRLDEARTRKRGETGNPCCQWGLVWMGFVFQVKPVRLGRKEEVPPIV